MTRSARIVQVLGTSAGGVGVHARSLVAHLVARGFDVTVAAPRSTQAGFDFPGARVVTVPIQGAGRETMAVPALRRAIRGAELVHAHGLRAGTAAVLTRASVRPSRRVPLVVTWHNAVLARGLTARLLEVGERLVAGGASMNLGASADLVERIRALGGRNVRLAPVAPPRPQPTRSTEQVRAVLGLADGTALVAVVARLHPQKGLDALIDASARLRSSATIAVAGDGPLRSDLQARIDRTNAPVRLLGRLGAAAPGTADSAPGTADSAPGTADSEAVTPAAGGTAPGTADSEADTSAAGGTAPPISVADLLAAADLVVLPSRWEARPLVAQEAMALGRPLLATDVGGVAGLVGDGARLTPPDDVDALTQAMDALLADPTARAELGARGAEVAASWPDEQAAARIVESLYDELLGVPSEEAAGDPPELLG